MTSDRTHVVQPRNSDRHSDLDELDTFPTTRVLWRRKTLIICTTIALTMIMTAIILQLTPSYSATSYIMIEDGNTEIVDAVAAVMVGGSADSETVESELRVLKSRMLADRAVTELQLDKDPEFNSSLRSPGFFDRFLAQVKAVFGWTVSMGQQPAGLTAGEDLHLATELLHAEPVGAERVVLDVKEWIVETLGGAEEEVSSDQDLLTTARTKIVDRFLSHLNVSVDGLSRVIAVTFRSENPKTAANAANTLTDLYIVSKLERKFEAAKTANRWINERIAELRNQVEAAEDAVEKYRAQNDLISSNDVMLSTQEATELSAQLALARAQRAEAEARLRELESAVGGPESVSEVLKSGIVAQLRVQEAEVNRKVADLAQYVGANHPSLVSARAELNQIQSQIQIEVGKIASALSNDLVAAQAREGSLSESLEKLKGAAGMQNQVEVKLRALQREATASRTMLETFLLRAQETSSQETFQSADAHIVSRADVPQSPTFPQKKTLLLASILGSLAIGVLLAFSVEMLSQGFRSEEQVEQILGVASLGLIPSVKRTWGKRERLSVDVMKHPASAYAESLRNLYTGIRLSSGENLPKAILIASSLPKEGKTTVVVSFAMLLSSAGLRTIVVDTDLRKPAVHRAMAVASSPGLVNYLTGELPLEAVIQKESVTGIAVIAAGSRAVSPPNLLGTERMTELLVRLKADYDVVILDSAPVLAVSDTRMLVRAVERTVYLVRWEDTRRDVAMRGLQQIHEAGGKVAGIMLTMVNFEKYSKYRYGTFGRYYHRIEGYYRA